MPKATVEGGVSGTVRTPLFFQPSDGGKTISVFIGEKADGAPALTISAPESNRLAIEVSGDPRVDLVNGEVTREGTLDVGKPKRGRPKKADETPFGLKRNWKVQGENLYVWHNGREVSLPMTTPGPHTPQNVPEVWGQDEMLFDLAVAFKTGNHALLSGPTGTAKTTACRFMAMILGWDFYLMPISRGTEATHMVGEYLPGAQAGEFLWTDGPVTEAARNSQTRPTIVLFDEMNRIGNVAEFSRLYSLLDDSQVLDLPERRQDSGAAEAVKAGMLHVCATINPPDSEDMSAATYVGVQELDPALMSRFGIHPKVNYPPKDVETKALASRVEGMDLATAKKMVEVATKIRESGEVIFPISMRELIVWGQTLTYYDVFAAAERAVVNKAHPDYRSGIRNIVKMIFKD